ncbi:MULTISPECIES: pyrroline-5-carboxylate reductase ProG [Bacillus]|mgnify:CR=1 FL=1|uniref:pyrroline-5-carboxylate reductase ProG n=1 Tax=Bacillus licheniformis TaxID=1402 RepID=UPI000779AC15|nr:pyrroline-5-carboxylate reductase ProG [Bacillus licheniformis]ATI75610.1 pyrroline-5-carboxylate reductase [Bacillus licheniformis]KYC70672.1 Pyrroline-5-carboxylate reductase, ProG-like [Bacillus licheniformis]MEC2366376.1 pyrroline-5-carboxylate reductase ProG [Bacillus licheniformis]MEC3534466.1 pyrroline-5-carboxylate reductase ProG [Bacillus licheniformis]MED0694129.1 pyrroline-5-carboxylate reductase ProG [Bacillus licheniformis]
MNKIGFIGYGSMAQMIAVKLLDQGKIRDDMVVVSSRNDGKTEELKKLYPNVACQSADEIAKQCGLIFICVPPMAVKETLEKIQPFLQEDVHIVSIAAGVELDRLHDWTSGQVTRYIPTLTSEAGIGVSLVVHGERVAEADKSRLEEYLSAFSTVKQINERDIDAASNLTSSSPGFIASIFEEFAQAAVRNSSLTKEEAFQFLIHSLLGTGKLLMEKDMTFAQTLDRVATKGGITAEGAEVIQDAMPEVFDELFARTMKKYEVIKDAVRRQ